MSDIEPEEKLSDEQIRKAAEASAPPREAETTNETSEGFDPRIIVYVSLPALVLVAQLFFTFSRDALGDVALGPAVMDLYIP
mmetsp:Transcript_38107/g.94741  ORF Transcript_38107/g.94741 Transcript_38107/m.94741 type:complete len:82 (+) Transcript_38107:2863-3108(+)